MRLKSWRRCHVYNILHVTSKSAIYLDSVDDRAMMLCFFGDYEMAPVPRNMAYPLIDFLSLESPAKSASEYAYKDSLSLPSVEA